MKKRTKLVLFCLLASLLTFVFLCATFFYFYSHPQKTKRFLVSLLKQSIHREIELDSYDFKLKPLALSLHGLRVFKQNQRERPELFLNELVLKSERSAKGVLGKFLKLESLRIDGLRLTLTPETLRDVLKVSTKKKESFIKRRFMAWLAGNIQKNFSIEEVSIMDVDVLWRSSELEASITGMDLDVGRSTAKTVGPLQFNADTIEAKTGSESLSVVGLKGNGKISKGQRFPAVAVKITSSNFSMKTERADIPAGSFVAMASFRYPHCQIKKILFKIPQDNPLLFHDTALPRIWGTVLGQISLNLKSKKITAASLSLSLMDVLKVRGSGKTKDGHPDVLQVDVSSEPIATDTIAVQFEKQIPFLKGLKPITPWHPAISGKVDINVENWKTLSALKAEFRLTGKKIVYGYDHSVIEGLLGVNAKIWGAPKNLNASWNLSFSEGRIHARRGQKIEAELDASLSYQASIFRIESLKLYANPLGRCARIRAVHADATGSIDIRKKTIDLASHIKSKQLGAIAINASGGWAKGNNIKGTIKFPSNDYGSFIKELTHMKRTWNVSGKASNNFSILFGEDWNPRITLSSKIEVYNLSDPDLKYAGEKLIILSRAYILLHTNRISFSGDISVPKGEIVLGSYYADFKQNPSSLIFKGNFNTLRRMLELKYSRLNLEKIVTIAGHGTLLLGDKNTKVQRISITLPPTSVIPLYTFFVKEPYGDTICSLKSLRVNGKIRARALITGSTDSLQVRGKVSLDGVSLNLTGKKSGSYALSGSIPLWTVLSGKGLSGKTPEEPLLGELEINTISMPLLGKQKFLFKLEARANTLSVKKDTCIKNSVFDIRIKPIEIDYIYPKNLHVASGLHVTRINVRQLLHNILKNPTPAEGVFSGDLSKIDINRGLLTSEGSLNGNIFDGTVKVSNITGENVFSSERIVGADIDFDNINLEKLTRILNFGKITGVLKGYIHNLKIAYGQPLSFDAVLTTVRKKGVRQVINVQAVNNIAELGSSGSPFKGLGKLLTVFFKEFPYEKIGIRCTLHNDVFTIRGTVISDHTEYLVKRRGFVGINVINRNPHNTISFKDMMKRLERITKTGHPVIK